MRNPVTMMPEWDFHKVPQKPSSNGGATQQTVNKTELPGWVSQAGQKNLDQAYNVSQNLMGPYGGQRVADMTPAQMANINSLQSLVGGTNPAYGVAQNAAADVSGYQSQGITPSFLGGMDLSGYMNPFTSSVIGTGLAGLDVQRQQAIRGIGDQALQAKAFGGSRQGIAEGITNTGAATQAGNLAAQLGYQNFAQAQQAATGDISRDLAAQQFNEQARANAAGIRLQGASTLGNLASSGQQAQIQSLMAAMQGQQMAQTQNQSVLDALRQYYQEQQQFPIQQLQIPLQALGMTPYGQTQTQTSPAPTSNPTMSALGGISTGIGILGTLLAPMSGGTSLLGTIASGASALSDERLKTDITPIGHDPNLDLPLYAYRYKGDPKTYPKLVGPMAQEVEKKYPSAVHQTAEGIRMVDFDFLNDVAGINAFLKKAA